MADCYLVYIPNNQILRQGSKKHLEKVVANCQHYSGYSDVYKILTKQQLKELEWEF